MEQVYIINKSTFDGFEDVSINVEAKRLNVFIKKAQDLDLKPFMGAAFYYDMIKSLVFDVDGKLVVNPAANPTTPQKYVDLINGKEYADRAGNLLYFDGIIPALVYWSFARFVEADAIRYTATGPVMKMHDNAESLKMSDNSKLVGQQRSVANAHANNIIEFLAVSKATYPLWQYNARNANSRQPGPRLRSVDAAKVNRGSNYPGYGHDYGFLSGLI